MTASTKKPQQRNYIPTTGQHVASKAGTWEAWLYTNGAGRPCLVFYAGRAQKPTAHHSYKTPADRMRHLVKLGENVDSWAEGRKARRAALAKPHTLTLGQVLVRSWGYDQTNVDYYEVTKLMGAHMVEVRAIASERIYTGDMQGKCVPCPGNYKGEPMRCRPSSDNRVKINHYGHAWPLEVVGRLPNGAPIYKGHHFTEYH